MKLQAPFDATQYDPSQTFGQLSIGRHPVIIESSEVKPTKEGTAGYLQVNLRVIDGDGIGQVGAMRYNLYNTSAKAVEIAHKQLSALCHVIGVFNLTDSSQLHNIPFIVDVGPQADPKYTEVKRVFDIRGNEPHRQGTGAPQGAAQPQGAAWGGQQQPPQQAPAQTPPQQQQPAWGQPQQAPQQAAPGATPQAWPQQQAPQQAPQQQAPWGGNPATAGGAPATAPNGAPPWGAPR